MNVALLVNLLAPCLPFLMKLGDKAAEKAAEKVGEQSAEKAGKIWAKLWPKVEAKEAAKEAAEDVAKAPEDEDSVAALRVQLKKLLAADEGLAAEVEALLKEAQADAGGTWIQQSVQGNNSKVIGIVIGSISGGIDVSGGPTNSQQTVAAPFPSSATSGESTRKIRRTPEGIKSSSELKKYNPLIRYSNIECPDKAQLNQKFSLIVELLIDKPAELLDSEVLAIEDTGTNELPKVEVVLSCRGFDLESSNTQVIQVKRVQDSSIRFTLVPRTLGQRLIKTNFYQNGKPLGQSKFEVFVYQNSGESDQGRVIRQASTLELGERLSITPQDLELYIDISDDEKQLSFSLHSSKSEINYHRKRIGEIVLRGSPLEKMKSVFREMSQLAKGNSNAVEVQAFAKHRLDAIGNELWDELIPEQLKREYWKFRTHVKSVLITSEEPWIPWELIKPYRYTEDGEQENSKFLCQEFSLSRWLSGGGMVGSLNMNRSRAVAPMNIDLPCVKEEVDFLWHLPSLNNQIISLETLNSRMQVLDSFKNEDLSIVHFACHGIFDSTSPNNSLIQLSDGELRPSDIQVKFGGKRQRPLVFINACHGSRAEFGFTGLGGWADRMLNARAGAFVGAMWEVSDKLALQFAKAFYSALLRDKETIAEAFRIARETIRQAAPHNSTWLAYTLYADPEGRIDA